MKALLFDNGLRLEKQYPVPSPGDDEALIRIRCVGICNTDLEITKGYMNFSGVLGHEFVGVVERAKLSEWNGKRVVGEINCSCEECELCQNGMEKHCRERSVLGIYKRDGCLAEYITLPVRNLRIVPDAVPDELAVFTEPMAAACEIFTQLDPRQFERPAVLGSGKLGLLCALALKQKDIDPLLIGRNKLKLRIAEKWGIRTSLIDKLKEADFDFLIEATGNPEGLKKAIELMRPRGTIVLKSTYAQPLTLDFSPVVINEVAILGSRCGPFDEGLAFIAEFGEMLRPMISGTFSLENAADAFAKAAEPDSLKILIKV